MKRRKGRVILAFAASAALMFSMAGATAMAAEDATETVYITESGEHEVGNVTVDYGYGVQVDINDGDSATVTTGSISSTDDDALVIYTEDTGTSATVTVNGDLNSDADDGMYASAEYGSSVNVTVNGNVSSDDDGIITDVGDEGSSATVTVNGDITSGYWGVSNDVYSGGSADITVNGTVSGEVSAVDSYTYGEGTSTSIEINGDAQGGSSGIDIVANGGESTVTVNGNVSGEYMGAEVYFSNGGTNNVMIDGDLTGTGEESVGLLAGASSEDTESTGDVCVTGTISGSIIGVLLTNSYYGSGGSAFLVSEDGEAIDTSMDSLTLTAWKIELNADGYVAGILAYHEMPMVKATALAADVELLAEKEAPEGPPLVQAVDFEKTIKYIVKLEQPSEGGTVSLTDASGNPLEVSHDFDVAYEGDTVILKANLEKGYKLVAAYNGEGEKMNLQQDADGNYYIVVPKGGGIYLSVQLEKVEEETPPTEPDIPEDPSGPSVPLTGDSSNPAMYMVFAGMFAAVLAIVVWRRKTA